MKRILFNKSSHPLQLLTDTELVGGIGMSENSRYGKLKRLVKSGELQRLRRGLYYAAQDQKAVPKPHPFELAQYVYGPSYISLESALSYYQLIPEAVYIITSVCVKRAKIFQTPLGCFSYQHLPTENFYTDVKLIEQNNRRFLLANPWKAICDYVYCYKKEWKDLKPLQESLRIDIHELPLLTVENKEQLNDYYHQKRIQRFLKGVPS